jgi:hypothetical protein
MNKLIGAFALLALLGATGTPANAAAWCAYYDPSTYNCGFHTLEQCRANISGVGGYCAPNYSDNRSQRRSSGRRGREGW